MTPPIGDSRLFEGGPLQHLARNLGRGAGAPRHSRAAVLAVLAGWVPLAVLVMAEGAVRGAPAFGSFAGDLAVHARQLLAAPLLILAEAVSAPRLDAIARHFLVAGLVEEPGRTRFEAALASTRGWVHSWPANATILVLAYALSLWLHLMLPRAAYPAWHFVGTGADGGGSALDGHTLAGWWHLLVSVPLLFLLMLGWIWRLWLWGRLLWLVSRMELRLVSSHPDRCAGLRFVGYSLRAFTTVAFAVGCVGAGRLANSVAYLGMSPFAHRNAIVVGAAVVVALFVAPLLVFTPRLLAEWRRGVFEYGALADRLGRGMEHRWFEEGPATERGGLEAAQEFSVVKDAYDIVANVHAMRLVPVDWKSIALLAAAVLLPCLAVALFSLPLDTIFRALARFFI